jgi:hypothetical protein
VRRSARLPPTGAPSVRREDTPPDGGDHQLHFSVIGIIGSGKSAYIRRYIVKKQQHKRESLLFFV